MLGKIKSFLLENQTAKQTVAKNTFWLTVTNFGGKLIKAVIIIYAARVLGAENYGVFSYAITLAGFLTLFMDPGINGILMRDASRATEDERRAIFDTTFAIKIFLLLVGVALIIFIAPLFSTLPGATALLPIVAAILALDTLRDFFSALMRAKEKMEKETLVAVVTNTSIVIFGFIFLSREATAQSFGWGYVAGDAVGLLVSGIILRSQFRNLFSHFAKQRIMPILRSAWPFAVGGAFGFLFTSTDILIISWLRNAADVGIYSAAIRIIATLYLIPVALQYSTLPLFSRLAKKDDLKFRATLERTLSMVFFASIPLSLGGIILGKSIIAFAFGAQYIPGGIPFQILTATLMFDFTATIIINALFAYDRQKNMAISAAFGGVSNVALNLLLIPPFGIIGCAIATLISQAIHNWYLWRSMRKVNYFEVFPRLKKIITGGAIMAVATLGFATLGLNVILNVVLSAFIYVGALWMLREPLLIDVKRLFLPAELEKTIA